MPEAALLQSQPAFQRPSILRVISAMYERIPGDFTMEEMAEVGNMSPFHFNRTFRDVTGIPPCKFYWALRIALAKRLLLTSDANVTDVCYDVGYASLGTFTRRFTHLVGISPQQFRDLAGEDLDGILGRAGKVRSGADPESAIGVAGRVAIPPGFTGRVLVGAFGRPIPETRPVACAVADSDGRFLIRGLPEGESYLLAVGLRAGADVRHMLLCEDALRGSTDGEPTVIRDHAVSGSTKLRLRPPEAKDPPLLLSLPLLMRERGPVATERRAR
jgi:AraC-like DNA-binding protein